MKKKKKFYSIHSCLPLMSENFQSLSEFNCNGLIVGLYLVAEVMSIGSREDDCSLFEW